MRLSSRSPVLTIPSVFTDGDPAELSTVENLLRENLIII
jgi:hypothetical protein